MNYLPPILATWTVIGALAAISMNPPSPFRLTWTAIVSAGPIFWICLFLFRIDAALKPFFAKISMVMHKLCKTLIIGSQDPSDQTFDPAGSLQPKLSEQPQDQTSAQAANGPIKVNPPS